MSDKLELSDFITSALVDIVQGIANAQEKIQELGGAINPNKYNVGTDGVKTDTYTVSFDIAVFAEASSSKDAGGRVKVMGWVEASIDGNESSTRNQRESRIKFEVPVKFPVGNNTDQFASNRHSVNREYDPYGRT